MIPRSLPQFAPLAIGAVLAGSLPVDAEPQSLRMPHATVTTERHHTTNALDAPLALEDWYSVLRGTLDDTISHEFGVTRFNAEIEAHRYDRYDIENDTFASVSTEMTVKPAENVELRGSIALRYADEGDNLPIGDIHLGTRTHTTAAAAGLELGVRLDPATVLSLAASAEREMPRDTRFQDDLLPPTRLEARRDRLQLGAALRRDSGAFSYGASAALAAVRAKAPRDNPLAFSSTQHTLRAEGVWSPVPETAVAVAAGVQLLIGENGLARELRPTYELSVLHPLPFGATVRGGLKGTFETRDTDDPLASWLRRAEVELAMPVAERLAAGIGLFDEMKENLVLGNRDLERGAFASLEWTASDHASLYLRVDGARRLTTVLDLRRWVVDTRFGVRMQL